MAKPEKHYGKWRIRWVDETGRRRSKSFVKYVEAERALRRFQVEVEERRLGRGQQPIEKRTFTELAAYQLQYKTSRKRSPKDDESILRAHLVPAFGEMELSCIGVREIAIFTDRQLKKVCANTVNKHLTLLGTMLRLAVDLNWLERIPRIQKLRISQKEFQYLRDARQTEKLLNEARNEYQGTFELYAAAVYTGCRAGELLGLEWSDIDFGRRLITIQRSFNKPTKTNRVRYVPILDPLLPVLRAWRLRSPLPVVFPNRRGNMHTPSPRVCQEILHQCLQRASLPRIRFHDLRHTFAAQWVMNGGDIYRLQKILGHASITMTERYAHLAPDVYAEDYGRLGQYIPTETAQIVDFRPR